jgi:hypothetical protein
MASVYHIVAIRVNETSWAHVWRLHFRYLRTECDNFWGNQENSQRREKRQMGRGQVMSRVVWSYNTTFCMTSYFTPFWLLHRAKAVLLEEIKHRSLWTAVEASTCPSKGEEKDLLEPDRLKVVASLQKYQDDTKAWRDLKVKLRELDVGVLVLLWSPRTENIDKLEAKWAGPYVVVEKSRPSTYCLSDPQGKMLEHSWNADSIHHFLI